MTGLPQCPVVRPSNGVRCGYVDHPKIRVHVDLSSGFPQQWIEPDENWTNVPLNGGDQLRDAPEALRKGNI